MLREFMRFKSSLSALAATLQIQDDELDPFRDYRDYMALLAEFLLDA